MRASSTLVLAAILYAGIARAADPETSSAEARRKYSEGHALYVAGKCQEAMPLLEQSNRLLPSPNSGFLIASCLATEGRRVEAVARYEEVEREATALMHNGETRYSDTAAAAVKAARALRSKLATLHVQFPRPHAGVTVEVDGKPIASDKDIVVLHEPGSIFVTFVSTGGRKERRVELVEGKESVLASEEGAKPAPVVPPERTPPPVPERRIPSWAILASGGVAAAGLGSFAGFGIASESTYASIESRCAPRCGAADEPDADRGRGFQTVANVGLVIGLTFAAAAAVLFALR